MNSKGLALLVIILIGIIWFLPASPAPKAGTESPAAQSAAATPPSSIAPALVSASTPILPPKLIPPMRIPTTRVTAGVTAAKASQRLTVQLTSAFNLSQIETAKARALTEHKPLGFIMVWGQFFGKETDTRSKGSVPALAHFYRAFNSNLVLVFVRHETELGLVPDAVKEGFCGPDEGGYAPNMAVVDATATEFIVEIPYGGTDSNGEKRDQVFAAGAAKIDQWLTTHPLAVGAQPAKP